MPKNRSTLAFLLCFLWLWSFVHLSRTQFNSQGGGATILCVSCQRSIRALVFDFALLNLCHSLRVEQKQFEHSKVRNENELLIRLGQSTTCTQTWTLYESIACDTQRQQWKLIIFVVKLLHSWYSCSLNCLFVALLPLSTMLQQALHWCSHNGSFKRMDATEA